jgi:hypothetical protein
MTDDYVAQSLLPVRFRKTHRETTRRNDDCKPCTGKSACATRPSINRWGWNEWQAFRFPARAVNFHVIE